MTDHPDKGKRRGVMPCDNCGEEVSVRVASQGLLYYICDNKKGGCGFQSFARTKDADTKLAERIAKWDDPAQRRAYLGDAALPSKARPKPEPADEPDGEPPEAESDDPPNDPAPEPSRARAKPARRTPPKSKPASKSPSGRGSMFDW